MGLVFASNEPLDSPRNLVGDLIIMIISMAKNEFRLRRHGGETATFQNFVPDQVIPTTDLNRH